MSESAGPSLTSTRALLRGAKGFAAVLASALALAAPPSALDEYVLKAQALVELSPYFTWPETPPPGRAFVIAVVGKSPFGAKLDAYAKGRTVQNRAIEILYVSGAAPLPPCNLVFICHSERHRAGEILERARGRGVLTVADDEELLGRGVMVDLLAEGGLLRLYVNPAAAVSEKFAIRSQLLRLAKIVDSP